MSTLIHVFLDAGMNQLDNQYWVPLAEAGVKTIYRLSEQPDTICGDILKRLAKVLLANREEAQEEAVEPEEGEQGLCVTIFSFPFSYLALI